MREQILERAQVLIQQQKFAEAERLLGDLLSKNPVDVQVLALLSEVNLQLDKTSGAETLVNTAIGISPDTPYLFYLKARIELQKENYDEAEENLRLALVLDAEDPHYYALWASVKLRRKQFERALELADKSLELDPENLLGLNIRSTALLKLGRKEDSFKTIEGALREDPNNDNTHANYGWNLLEKGDHKKALTHFREALKNNPDNDNARAGMGEALKASNLFYKLFLKYTFWINNLTAKYQWAVILGFYFGTRFLNTLAAKNEELRPFLNPLIILLAIIAFSTWVITPISNLFLRLNPYGKHLLDKKQMLSSNFVGISFLFFLSGALLYFLLGDDIYLAIAVFGFAMMVPLGVMFSPSKYKNSLVIYAGLMALIGLGAIALTFNTGDLTNPLSTAFFIGFIAFQFVANFLMIKESNV